MNLTVGSLTANKPNRSAAAKLQSIWKSVTEEENEVVDRKPASKTVSGNRRSEFVEIRIGRWPIDSCTPITDSEHIITLPVIGP